MKRKNTNKQLNEVQGWKLEEEDYNIVNSNDDNYYDKCYIVRICPGSGYYLPAYKVYANSEEEALYICVAWLEKNDPNMLVDDWYNERLKDGEDEEILDSEFIYIDATMEGADSPHYILADNLKIYEAPKQTNESKKFKNTIRLTESELHNLIKESVRKVLKKNTEYSVWDLLDEMKEYMSDYDILARLINRIGEDVAMDMLTDIKAIEIGDNDDTLTEGQGWNFFKSNHKDIWNGKYDDTFNKMSPEEREREKQDMDNYINADKKETHYNKFGEYSYPTTDDPNNKKTKVNKSKWGKIGRTAGVAGTIASLKARRALNNLKKDLKN